MGIRFAPHGDRQADALGLSGAPIAVNAVFGLTKSGKWKRKHERRNEGFLLAETLADLAKTMRGLAELRKPRQLVGPFSHRSIQSFDTFAGIVAKQRRYRILGPLFGKRALPDRAPKCLDHLPGYLLRSLAFSQLQLGDAPVKVRVRCLFADDAFEYLRKHRMSRDVFHSAISLCRGHFVDRPEGHVRRRERAAEEIG